MNDIMGACSKCAFYLHQKCRRYPPVGVPGMLPGTGYTTVQWEYPSMEPDDWCGEYMYMTSSEKRSRWRNSL